MRKLIVIFMLGLAGVLIMMNAQLKSKEVNHIERVQTIQEKKADYLFDVIIEQVNQESKQLVQVMKSDIIHMLEKEYDGRMDELKKELSDNLNGRSSESKAFKLIGDYVSSISLNNVPANQVDNNDPIILMRNPETDEYLIVIDLSDNCATENRFRNNHVEAEQQFATNLFYNAYQDLIYTNTPTIWSFLPVDTNLEWYSDVKYMKSTSLKDLREFFIRYEVDMDSLASFEFLNSDKIHQNEDLFGTPTKHPNGQWTKEDMPIVVISGYNLLNQIDLKPMMKINLEKYDEEIKKEVSRYNVYKTQNNIFSLLAILMFIMMFIYTHDKRGE